MKEKKEKPVPQFFEFSIDGVKEYLFEHPVLTKYSDRINNKIRAEFGVIEEIISHNPSIGTYYEKIFSSNFQEFLPSKWKIGTGFIFDDLACQTSPQIDIIVYIDSEATPIFKAGDLVVVRPEQVEGIIEIKKKLKLKDLDDLVEKYLFCNTGSEFKGKSGVQYLNIFSYEKATSLEKYYDRVVRCLKEKIESRRDLSDPSKIGHISNLTLPRIFFLNDERMIDCRLIPKNSSHYIEVELTGILYTTGGASDLFSRFILNTQRDDFNRIRFHTIGLYQPVKTYQISTPIILREFLTIRRLYSNLSVSDQKRVKKAELNKFQGVLAPYGLQIDGLEDLAKKMKDGTLAPIEKQKT